MKNKKKNEKIVHFFKIEICKNLKKNLNLKKILQI